MIGLIGSFLSRALPYIPRIANFVKSGIAHGIPAILKGVSKVKEFARKALPIVGAVQAGIETAKSLPLIGEKVKQIADRPAVQQVIKGAENILNSGGAYAEMLEKDLPQFVGKYVSPLM